jgi:hypothetical protein
MLLTRDSHCLFFTNGGFGITQNGIRKFSVNKIEVVAEFEDPALENGISFMALSPDSNSLYVGTHNKLLQLSLKDGNLMQSRNINERPDMYSATLQSMYVTRNNQYLVTSTTYSERLEKGTEEDWSEDSSERPVNLCGPVCVWSTKDLTLVKT